jgi:hypothetical protein
MVAYEIKRQNQDGSESTTGNSWCTADYSFSLQPQSSKEVWIWIKGAPEQFEASIFYEESTILSRISPFFRLFPKACTATAYVRLKELPNDSNKPSSAKVPGGGSR